MTMAHVDAPYTCLCTHVCTHGYTRVYTCVGTHDDTRVYTDVYSHAYACSVCAHVYTHAFAHVYACVCTQVRRMSTRFFFYQGLRKGRRADQGPLLGQGQLFLLPRSFFKKNGYRAVLHRRCRDYHHHPPSSPSAIHHHPPSSSSPSPPPPPPPPPPSASLSPATITIPHRSPFVAADVCRTDYN